MEARETYMPKTVDDLRVKTNPKLEYTLEDHEGPSYSHVQNRGNIGTVEKNRPDRYFVETPDRWFTTPGTEKAPMLHPTQEIHPTARNQQSKSYAGIAGPGQKQGTYKPPNYTASTKTNLFSSEMGPVSAVNKGDFTENLNAQIKSYKSFANNRSTTSQGQTFGSGLTTAIGAVVAPIMDVFSMTRRNDYPTNVRLYGDPGTTVPTGYLQNATRAPTTVKETTLYTPPLGLQNKVQYNQGAYVLNNVQPISNQRATTDVSYFGDGGAKWGGSGDVCTVFNQNTTKESTMLSRTNQGNMSLFNGSQGDMCMSKLEKDRENNRLWVPTSLPTASTTKEMLGQTISPNCDQPGLDVARNTADILNAFRANPYTHSLASY
jgi:hypothetical protein